MEIPNDQQEEGKAPAASGNDAAKIGAAIFGGVIGGVLIAKVVGGLVRMGVRMFGSAIATEVLRKPAGSRRVVREDGEPLVGGTVARATVSEVEVDFAVQDEVEEPAPFSREVEVEIEDAEEEAEDEEESGLEAMPEAPDDSDVDPLETDEGEADDVEGDEGEEIQSVEEPAQAEEEEIQGGDSEVVQNTESSEAVEDVEEGGDSTAEPVVFTEALAEAEEPAESAEVALETAPELMGLVGNDPLAAAIAQLEHGKISDGAVEDGVWVAEPELDSGEPIATEPEEVIEEPEIEGDADDGVSDGAVDAPESIDDEEHEGLEEPEAEEVASDRGEFAEGVEIDAGSVAEAEVDDEEKPEEEEEPRGFSFASLGILGGYSVESEEVEDEEEVEEQEFGVAEPVETGLESDEAMPRFGIFDPDESAEADSAEEGSVQGDSAEEIADTVDEDEDLILLVEAPPEGGGEGLGDEVAAEPVEFPETAPFEDQEVGAADAVEELAPSIVQTVDGELSAADVEVDTLPGIESASSEALEPESGEEEVPSVFGPEEPQDAIFEDDAVQHETEEQEPGEDLAEDVKAFAENELDLEGLEDGEGDEAWPPKGFRTKLPPPREAEHEQFQPQVRDSDLNEFTPRPLEAPEEVAPTQSLPEPLSARMVDAGIGEELSPSTASEEEEQSFDPIQIFRRGANISAEQDRSQAFPDGDGGESEGLAAGDDPGAADVGPIFAPAEPTEQPFPPEDKGDFAAVSAAIAVDTLPALDRGLEQPSESVFETGSAAGVEIEVEPVENPFAAMQAQLEEEARERNAQAPKPEPAAQLEFSKARSESGSGGIVKKTLLAVAAFAVIGGGAYYGWHSLMALDGEDASKPPVSTVRPPKPLGSAVPGSELPGAVNRVTEPATSTPDGEPASGTAEGEGSDPALVDAVASGADSSGEAAPAAGGASEDSEEPVGGSSDAEPGAGAGEDAVAGAGDPPADAVAGSASDAPQDAAATLKAFLAAPDWETRMQFVHLDGGVKAEMEEFYQANGDKPFEHSGITEKAKGKIPGSGKETYLYIVRTKEVPSGFAVSIEETDKGFKIDWRGFVQFGHGLLENFADDPNAEAQKFYAVAKRSHYFGSSVPNAENMLCVRVISPVNTEKEIYAFASEGSLAGEEIKEQLRWGRTYRPVLWLEWTGSGEQRYIRIKSVERLSWREAS